MSYLKTYLPYLFGNKKNQTYKIPQSIDWGILSFEETLMFQALTHNLDSFFSSLHLNELKTCDLYQLYNFNESLNSKNRLALINHEPIEWKYFIDSFRRHDLNEEDVQKLFNHPTGKLSVFALLDKDRTKPGRLFIRKANGHFHLKANGSVWTKRVLGLSSRGLPFCHTNGSTPTGVYAINSVMPEANHTYEFGLNRRVKIHFCEPQELTCLLPPSLYKKSWYQEALVALKLGRSLFRIHGSGRVNKNPFLSYFPLVPSSGCLTLSELNVMGLYKIDDQREFLDSLMKCLDLDISFTNELKIHGHLYVMNFDGSYQALEFK